MEQGISINTVNAKAFLRQQLFLQPFMFVVTDTQFQVAHKPGQYSTATHILKKIQLHSNATLIFAL